MSRPNCKPTIYTLKKENHFVTKIGTNTTEEMVNVVFIRAKTMLTPNENKKTYKEEILSLKEDFEIFANDYIQSCSEYENNYIFTMSIAEESVKFHKTSHLHYDLFVKSKEKHIMEEHKVKLEKISDLFENKLIHLFKKYKLKWF